MTHEHEPDPLLLSLTRLPVADSSAARDARIKERCHAALDRRRAARAAVTRPRPLMARFADAALTAVLCGYATVALLEAFRLIH